MMKLSSGKERILWMSFIVILLFISLVLKREATDAARQVKIAAQGLKENKRIIDNLAETVQDLKVLHQPSLALNLRKSGLSGESVKAYLKGKGLSDPVNDLIADLQEHPELIPHQAALGGKLGFYSHHSIYVLNTRWVLAGFEDGHNAGNALLKYEVSKGKISWQVIDSYLQE